MHLFVCTIPFPLGWSNPILFTSSRGQFSHPDSEVSTWPSLASLDSSGDKVAYNRGTTCSAPVAVVPQPLFPQPLSALCICHHHENTIRLAFTGRSVWGRARSPQLSQLITNQFPKKGARPLETSSAPRQTPHPHATDPNCTGNIPKHLSVSAAQCFLKVDSLHTWLFPQSELGWRLIGTIYRCCHDNKI